MLFWETSGAVTPLAEIQTPKAIHSMHCKCVREIAAQSRFTGGPILFRTCGIIRPMTASVEQGPCAHCGGAIPARADPRGRRARYCSGACRAAASRARAATQAAVQSLDDDRAVGVVEDLASVAEARQLTPDEFDRARRIVDAAARISEAHRVRATPSARADLAATNNSSSLIVAAGLSRQQRRARERAARKASR